MGTSHIEIARANQVLKIARSSVNLLVISSSMMNTSKRDKLRIKWEMKQAIKRTKTNNK